MKKMVSGARVHRDAAHVRTPALKCAGVQGSPQHQRGRQQHQQSDRRKGSSRSFVHQMQSWPYPSKARILRKQFSARKQESTAAASPKIGPAARATMERLWFQMSLTSELQDQSGRAYVKLSKACQSLHRKLRQAVEMSDVILIFYIYVYVSRYACSPS